jgi:hypothetical protein
MTGTCTSTGQLTASKFGGKTAVNELEMAANGLQRLLKGVAGGVGKLLQVRIGAFQVLEGQPQPFSVLGRKAKIR